MMIPTTNGSQWYLRHNFAPAVAAAAHKQPLCALPTIQKLVPAPEP